MCYGHFPHIHSLDLPILSFVVSCNLTLKPDRDMAWNYFLFFAATSSCKLAIYSIDVSDFQPWFVKTIILWRHYVLEIVVKLWNLLWQFGGTAFYILMPINNLGAISFWYLSALFLYFFFFFSWNERCLVDVVFYKEIYCFLFSQNNFPQIICVIIYMHGSRLESMKIGQWQPIFFYFSMKDGSISYSSNACCISSLLKTWSLRFSRGVCFSTIYS